MKNTCGEESWRPFRAPLFFRPRFPGVALVSLAYPCYVEIVKCVFSVQGLFPSKKWKEPLAPLLPGSRSFPHPFTRTQTRSSIESNDNLLFDAQDQPETPVLHFSLRPDQTGYRT